MSVYKSYILWKENKPNKHEELTEWEIFEKIKQEIAPLQESLSTKSITVHEAKSELKRINEWIKWTNLQKEKQQKLWNAFDKLTKNLEKNIDKNNLQTELNEIVTLLENLTQKDLASLKQGIQQSKRQRNSERPDDIQQWIDESSKEFLATIHDASQDQNPVAKKVWERMEKLMS